MATYIAPAATHIFGVFYAKGATVDVSTWPDRAITRALDRGWITPAGSAASGAHTPPVVLSLYGPGGALGPWEIDTSVAIDPNNDPLPGVLLSSAVILFSAVAGLDLKLQWGAVDWNAPGNEAKYRIGYAINATLDKVADATGVLNGTQTECSRASSWDANYDDAQPDNFDFVLFSAPSDTGFDGTNYTAPDANTIHIVNAGWYKLFINLWAGAPSSP